MAERLTHDGFRLAHRPVDEDRAVSRHGRRELGECPDRQTSRAVLLPSLVMNNNIAASVPSNAARAFSVGMFGVQGTRRMGPVRDVFWSGSRACPAPSGSFVL